jgi:hypothetical protein
MKLHRNAKLSVKDRELLIERIEGTQVAGPVTGPKGLRGCWIAPRPVDGCQPDR